MPRPPPSPNHALPSSPGANTDHLPLPPPQPPPQQQQATATITDVLPGALLGCILGKCGLWGDATAGWSVCRAWRDAMEADPCAVAEALLSHKAGRMAPALFAAIKHGSVRVVHALLSADAGAHVDMGCTEHGSSPLMVAASLGHVELELLALLSAGARVNLVRSSTTPLWVASLNGHLEVVRALLSAGALVNLVKADTGASPLYAASQGGHVEVVRALLSAGAQVDLVKTDTGASPLLVASHNGRLEVVRALLSAGAQVDLAKADDGASPLHVSSLKGHLEVVRALLSAGATVDLQLSISGRTPLYMACQGGHDKVALALVSYGAQPGRQAHNGKSALHMVDPLLRTRMALLHISYQLRGGGPGCCAVQ